MPSVPQRDARQCRVETHFCCALDEVKWFPQAYTVSAKQHESVTVLNVVYVCAYRGGYLCFVGSTRKLLLATLFLGVSPPKHW